MNDAEARHVLGLPQNVSLSKVCIKRAWKAAAICTHPDRGGTPEAFVRVSEAAQTLKRLDGVPNSHILRERRPQRPRMQLLGPTASRRKVRGHIDRGYWDRQRDMESIYGNLGSYGRDGLTRTWYWWHGGKQ